MTKTITVNGRRHTVELASDEPLLYVLRNELDLNGPLFGCGLAQCGACAVLHGDKEIRSCVFPTSAVTAEITTSEGLAAKWNARHPDRKNALHPLQQAWIAEQTPQCGYCQNGMMIAAASLLARMPDPSHAQIVQGMDAHLCRCGTQPRIVKSIARAAKVMKETVS